MGSEQSAQQTQSPASNRERSVTQLRRGKSIPEREVLDDTNRSGNISPGPSICSDSDLPYISYTVNRPIGDSPKLPQKHGTSHLKRGKSLGTPGSRKNSAFVPKRQLSAVNKPSTHSIVVVKPASSSETTDKDPELIRLQSVPMFLPIMRGTLNLPAARDPEVLERLDPGGPLALCQRYQQHLIVCSDLVSSEQAALGLRVREVDSEVSRLLALMTERQKRCAKYAERLIKVHELSHQLNRCHTLLNQTLESMETLNNWLPLEDRLEPFVWTTG